MRADSSIYIPSCHRSPCFACCLFQLHGPSLYRRYANPAAAMNNHALCVKVGERRCLIASTTSDRLNPPEKRTVYHSGLPFPPPSQLAARRGYVGVSVSVCAAPSRLCIGNILRLS